jgi:single-stranded-DNA-specific exonuclease
VAARAPRWLLPTADPGEAERLASALSLSPLAVRVLVRRGFRDPAAAHRFLAPSLGDLHDPRLLLGMDAAVERLSRAIAARERILLYGDYDVDGATAAVILKKSIELAGGQAAIFIPHRIRDGYGMRTEVIEQAAADGATLIVSLDTGIRAAAALRRARELNLDVIVTDHHLPEAELPPALAIVNPMQPGCPYPEKNLCGAGVAFKLAQALFATLGWPPVRLRSMTESFMKLVAIATVADVVPLTGENRILVKHGLDGLRSLRNPGLRALASVAGFEPGQVPTAGQVAFRIAPRLNAAGRMADANDVIELLLTEDEARAGSLAVRLDALNRERQDAEAAIIRHILAECLAAPVRDDQAALVFLGDDWHRGVVGIVATRLVERFHRPVFVLGRDAERNLAQGSGRSIPAFHLLEALESMPDLFLRFGGHRQAAGVALDPARVEEFRERLSAYAAARLTPDDFAGQIELDAIASFDELTDQAVAEVLSMAPFGCGNPAPVFAALGAEVAAAPVVIKEKHLRVTLRHNGRPLTLKAWNFAPRAVEFSPGARLDAAFTLEPDDYSRKRGYAPWSAVLRDVRQSNPK